MTPVSPFASSLSDPRKSARLKPSSTIRALVVGAALLAPASLVLSGCAGIKVPAFMQRAGGQKGPKPKLPGVRVAVLPDSDTLKVNDALKGVGFQIPAAKAVPAWPQPGGPLDTPVEHADAAPTLEIAWRHDFGKGAGRTGQITAQPIVVDGRVYVMDAEATVSALDAKTGREIWKVSLGDRRGPDREATGGGVAFDGGRIFVSSGYRFVAALDASTGKQIWRRRVDAPLHSAPVVYDGKVYVSDVGDQLLTFAAADGSPGWTYQALEETARVFTASSVAASGDVVVAPFASGELTALNTANGSELWSFVLSLTNRNNALSEIRDIAGRPLIYRGDVLAGSHSGVFAAVDLRSGQPRWSLPITSISTPWPAGDVIYITDQEGRVICVSREAGQVYWITDLNKDKKPKLRAAWSGPVLSDGRLVVTSNKGELVALDPITGEKKRTVNLRVKVGTVVPPTPAEGMLYVATGSGDLVALR